MQKKGKLFIILGPSGVGKGTILKEFLAKNANAIYSISTTTRRPREGEVNGVHYNFTTRENFEELINKNDFLEYAEYSGNYYGTSKSFVEEKLNSGLDVILEIEVQGAKKVLSKMPETVSVFILPPSKDELERRLIGRRTETADIIQKRLEVANRELNEAKKFKYNIVNNEVNLAVDELQKIYESEKNAQ